MKINDNNLNSLLKFYKLQLSGTYNDDEITAVFYLVCDCYLGFSKSDVLIKLNDRINQSDLINIYNTCNKLKTGKPIQYILNEAYFFELKFKVNSSTLIPRPETEELVYLITQTITEKTHCLHFVDIGTGSGCIPIKLKKHYENSDFYGLDISESALEIAKFNAKLNNVDVNFFITDILNANHILNLKFDCIISNPPYISKSEAVDMEDKVLNYEPNLALFVEDNDPIIFYKRIIDLCLHSLSNNGYLFFELNPFYAIDVMNYANASNLFKSVEIIIDMSGKQRFLIAQK
jgi:release factor glutamine methyltransferase